MATLRDVQKRQTRRLLLTAGLEMFAVNGYSSTTIEDIAKHAGATRATFYLHFPSKSELMSELVRETDSLLTRSDDLAVDEVLRVGSRGAIESWLESKIDRWEHIRPHLDIVFQAETAPDIAAIIDAWHDDTIGRMREGLDRADRFDASTRRVRCVLAFGALEAASRRWMRLGWTTTSRDTTLRQLTETWLLLLALPAAGQEAQP